MSPDFYPDGPVKGVDGEEYSTCPRCGEDFLQLEGSNIAEWGWKIVCMDCGWEMKQVEGLDIAQYCALMEEVKSKVESINQLMEVPGLTIRTRVESISLQLRMLLELLVVQLSGIQQGCLGEVEEGVAELPGYKQEGPGAEASPSSLLPKTVGPEGEQLRTGAI